MAELRYIWEKLHGAVRALSCIDKPLRDRLEYARQELHTVEQAEIEALFEDDESRLEQIRLVYGGLDPDAKGAQRLGDVEAHDVAESLVSVYDEVTRRMGSRSGP